MAETLLVVGYGPGISHAVARRFGREGYRIALVGRTASRLDDGVAALAGAGLDVTAFPADASDPDALREVLTRVRHDVGPVSVLLWTAFRGGSLENVLDASPEDVDHVFDVGVRGLLTAVRELLPDLRASEGSVLVANGALGDPDEQVDRYGAMLGGDGVSLENAAKSKLVGLLAAHLHDDGVYVGQITVQGTIAGTATASPTAIPPTSIAEQFWSMATDRAPVRARVVE